MCLAAVYAQKAADNDGAKELVLDKVQLIEADGDRLTCTNLFGKTLDVCGTIKTVDLANSTVVVLIADERE